MEHVESKDVIREKRLQVFADDVMHCRKRSVSNEVNIFEQPDYNVVFVKRWSFRVRVRVNSCVILFYFNIMFTFSDITKYV